MTPNEIAAQIVERLQQATNALGIVDFNERKQQFFCRACRYRDPLGPDGNKLHDDNCPWLEYLTELEKAAEAIAAALTEAQQAGPAAEMAVRWQMRARDAERLLAEAQQARDHERHLKERIAKDFAEATIEHEAALTEAQQRADRAERAVIEAQSKPTP